MTSCCIYLPPIRLKSLMKPDLKPTAIVSSNSEATIKEGGSDSEVLNSWIYWIWSRFSAFHTLIELSRPIETRQPEKDEWQVWITSSWCDLITILKELCSSSNTERVPSHAITHISEFLTFTSQLAISWLIETSETSLLKSGLQILRLPSWLALSMKESPFINDCIGPLWSSIIFITMRE